jgi:Zn-dependent peptidase ImmA (M78 family)
MSNEITRRVVQLRKASSIEEAAHQVRLSVWNNRFDLFRGVVPENPLDMLEPGIALHLRGFKVETAVDLGEMFDSGKRVRVAGLIDQNEKTVHIAAGLTLQETRFTTGHELGHAVLHPMMTGLHRDRGVSGPLYRKDRVEADADRFTSAYLMSPKLLLREFIGRFGVDVFRLSSDSVFGLGIAKSAHKLRNTRDISYAVANATSYMGRHFPSLTNAFRVSSSTMAIRLEELGLIEDFVSRRMW